MMSPNVAAQAELTWNGRFGTASRRELAERLALVVARSDSPLGAAIAKVEREHVVRYGAVRLAAELNDEHERAAAREGDSALVAYSEKWLRRLAKLQRRYGDRWRVAGLSDNEVRDELTLRLIEAVRGQAGPSARHERAGREWSLVFLAAERRTLRRAFRLNVVVADLAPVVDARLGEEERLISLEAEAARLRASQQAELGLSRPQRRWLSAMQSSARAGGFFAASGKLNLAAVSRELDRDRSSAQRAFEELQRRYVRELRRLGE